MSCCDHAHGHHAHAHGGGEDDLDEEYLAHDPTLSSCCERDRRDYNKAMKLKAELTAHDPTSGGVRLRQQLFQPPAAPSAPRTCTGELAVNALAHSMASLQAEKDEAADEDDSDFDSDDDDEFGVAGLLAARRKEMELQMQQAAQDVANGFGIVQAASADALARQVREEREVPKVVLFSDVRGERLASLERAMAAAAARYVGTRFFSVQVRDGDGVRQLGLRRLPCAAAFRGGERVDATPVDESALHGAEDAQALWEATLLPWLSMCGVLSTERRWSVSSAAAKPREEAEEEPRGFDCGMDGCRLRFSYEHEHVGSSKEVRDDISAWRQTTPSR